MNNRQLPNAALFDQHSCMTNSVVLILVVDIRDDDCHFVTNLLGFDVKPRVRSLPCIPRASSRDSPSEIPKASEDNPLCVNGQQVVDP